MYSHHMYALCCKDTLHIQTKANELYIAYDVTRYTKTSQLIKIFNICAPEPLFRWSGLWDYSDTMVCHIRQETLIPFYNSRHLYASYMYHNH